MVGDLTLGEDSHEVRRGDSPVELTATEFELPTWCSTASTTPTPRGSAHRWQLDLPDEPVVVHR